MSGKLEAPGTDCLAAGGSGQAQGESTPGESEAVGDDDDDDDDDVECWTRPNR